MKTTILFIVSLLGSALIAPADIMWPTDGAWTPITSSQGLYNDSRGDVNPASIDLVGSADAYSAGYWARVENGSVLDGITDDALMFRMRLRGSGEGKNYVWQALLDTDNDASNVEWILQLVQSGSSTGVELIKTAIGGPSLNDVTMVANNSWLGDLSEYSRWTQAIYGSTDYHVDLAIPWSEFTAITGTSDTGNIRAILSTSTAHNQTNKDAPLGPDGPGSFVISDSLSESIPEPTVASLILGAGGGLIFYRRFRKRSLETKEDQA